MIQPFDRGVLEQLIDNAISDMKTIVDIARDDMFQESLNDKNGNDFALGLALGQIQISFFTGFKLRNNRLPTSDETAEIFKIISSRLRDFKESIFKCG